MSNQTTFYCHQCKKRLKTSKKLTSKTLHCPLCGAQLDTSVAGTPTSTRTAASPAPATKSARATKPAPATKRAPSSVASRNKILIAAGVGLVGLTIIIFLLVRLVGTGDDSNASTVADADSLPTTPDLAEQPTASDSESRGDPRDAEMLDPNASDLSASSNTPYVDREYAYQFNLTAEYPDQQYEWNGEIVLGLLPDRPVTVATGIAIPNRWIIVPLSLIKDAESIQVIHQGKRYDAEVRRKLTKLGWATLQIDRREKFPSPKADRADRLTRSAKGLRVVYLNQSGVPQVRAGLSVSGGSDGSQYQIPPLPEAALGGIVLHDSGRIAGLVTSTGADRSILMPWSKIGNGWGANAGEGIFDYDDPLPDELVDSPERFGDNLVQVAVEKTQTRKTTPQILFQSSVRRVQASGSPSQAASALIPNSVQNSSRDQFRLERSLSGLLELEPTSRRKPAKPNLLPFGLGLPVKLTVMPISSAGSRRWTAQESVRVHYGRGTGIRHPEGNDRTGFTSCSGDCKYFVIEGVGNRFQFTREFQLRNNPQLPVQITQTGKENVTLDLESGFVRERRFDGELNHTFAGASPISIKVHYELKMLRSPKSDETPRYWR